MNQCIQDSRVHAFKLTKRSRSILHRPLFFVNNRIGPSFEAMICGDCHICGHTHRSALQYYSTCPSSNKGCRGCNMVTKLQRDIEETAKKLTQLLADLQRAKTEMNYCHSTIIKKLPTEIVSTIFENFVASSIDL